MTARCLHVAARPVADDGTVRHAVTSFLRDIGLTTIFGNPGSTEMPLLLVGPFLFAERPTGSPQPFGKWACEPARAQDVPAAIAREIESSRPCAMVHTVISYTTQGRKLKAGPFMKKRSTFSDRAARSRWRRDGGSADRRHPPAAAHLWFRSGITF